MKSLRSDRGFTLLEVAIGVAVFLLFAIGIFSSLSLVFKMVYQSRLRVLQTAVATEQIEIIRNLPFASVGISGGVPSGVLEANKTITRSGVVFSVTTTVRNVDDPFDGTATSTPADEAPADYKMAQVWVQCVSCEQWEPVIMTTHISPKGLETETENGSLYIHVVNANGLPVSGATVRIENASTSPAIDVTELTDNDGWLRLLDTPTGTLSYHIEVTKNGYSSDYTIIPSASNPSPSKLPASVETQTVTTVNLSIDQLGSMNIATMSPSCSPIGSTSFNVRGEKQVGSLPVVYKYDHVFSTNASGNYGITTAEWDTYHFFATGTTYDLAGTIPMSPFSLLPGATQDVSLILRPHTSRSLLVKVKDSGTGLPLSGATVRLTATGYDQSQFTGLGYVQQTDWSGGAGQTSFTDDRQYFSDDARVDSTSVPGELRLKSLSGTYLFDGYLESSTFDLATTSNFSNLIINPSTQPTSTGSNTVRLQLATSNSSTPASWDFLGPDGTDQTYYTVTNTVVNSVHNGNQYVRYRAYLQTADSAETPSLSDVSITYTTSCVAPGQSFFNGLAAETYTLEVSRSGYTTNSGLVTISDNQEVEVNLSPL